MKHFYDSSEYENDILYCSYNMCDTHMKEWLEHFVKFDTYLEFFMFDNFVVEQLE